MIHLVRDLVSDEVALLLAKLLHVSQQQRQRRELGLQEVSLLGIDLRGELRRNVRQRHAVLVMPKLQGSAVATVVDVGATAARSDLQHITAIFIHDQETKGSLSRYCVLWSCAFIV